MYGAEVACNAGTEEDGILSDSYRRLYNGGSSGGDGGSGYDGDDDYDEDGSEVTRHTNRRRGSLDECRLLAWRREEKPWKWIFDQFPDRTGKETWD